MLVALDHFGEAAFIDALRHAPPSILDRRNWHFWHAWLGLERPTELPRRRFIGRA